MLYRAVQSRFAIGNPAKRRALMASTMMMFGQICSRDTAPRSRHLHGDNMDHRHNVPPKGIMMAVQYDDGLKRLSKAYGAHSEIP